MATQACDTFTLTYQTPPVLSPATVSSPFKPPPSLPQSVRVVRFVGEGAANIVFELASSDNVPKIAGKLLRVQKAPRDAHSPHLPPYEEIQLYWVREIRAMFPDPDCLVSQELVTGLDPNRIDECNQLLQQLENKGRRNKKFIGDRAKKSNVGMLVDDMRARWPHERMTEFKPKWLSQSRTAPPGAIRCRTCASTLRRFLMYPTPDAFTGWQSVCSLSLCDDQDADSAILLPPPPSSNRNASLHATDVSLIRGSPLMRRLRVLQDELDRTGPLALITGDGNFEKAMTLRDCTCFLRVVDGKATCRLGDLDQKSGDVKAAYWRNTERELIDGGFYTARRLRVGGVEYSTPGFCRLRRRSHSGFNDHATLPDSKSVSHKHPSTIEIIGTDGHDDATASAIRVVFNNSIFSNDNSSSFSFGEDSQRTTSIFSVEDPHDVRAALDARSARGEIRTFIPGVYGGSRRSSTAFLHN